MGTLHYETVSPLLKKVLHLLMAEELFKPFRLVGGTNLSLRYGHRQSEDIDLFTDVEYGSLDFNKLEYLLRWLFPCYESSALTSIVGFGRSYYIGFPGQEPLKLDLMYTDPFLEPVEVIDSIRMASVEDIIAMKVNVVSRGGRKKDFWDLHFLLAKYSFPDMFSLHERRHPWVHETTSLLDLFTSFELADTCPDPVCFLGKNWDDIKLDFVEQVDDFGKHLTK